MARPKSVPGGVEVVHQHVSDTFANTLVSLYLKGQRRDRPGHALFMATLSAAHRKGWTLTALAEPLCLSRERVRQRLRDYDPPDEPPAGLPEIPEPPRRPLLPSPPRDPRLTRKQPISDGMAAWLRDMYRTAKLMRGSIRLDDPRRGVSEAFTAVLADLQDQGVSAGTIAKAIGCRPQTIYFRLRRHGYRHNAPSQLPYRRLVTPNVAKSKRRTELAPGERYESWLDRQGPLKLPTVDVPRPTKLATTLKGSPSGGAP